MASYNKRHSRVLRTCCMIISLQILLSIQYIYGSTDYSLSNADSPEAVQLPDSTLLDSDDSKNRAEDVDNVLEPIPAEEVKEEPAKEKKETLKFSLNNVPQIKVKIIGVLSMVLLALLVTGTLLPERIAQTPINKHMPFAVALVMDMLFFYVLDYIIQRFFSPRFTDSSIIAFLIFAILYKVRGPPRFSYQPGVTDIRTILKSAFTAPFVAAAGLSARLLELFSRLKDKPADYLVEPKTIDEYLAKLGKVEEDLGKLSKTVEDLEKEKEAEEDLAKEE